MGDEGVTPRQRSSQLTAGLGLLPGVIVDQHFDQRARYGRLLSLVAGSPNLLGMGILLNISQQSSTVAATRLGVSEQAGVRETAAQRERLLAQRRGSSNLFFDMPNS